MSKWLFWAVGFTAVAFLIERNSREFYLAAGVVFFVGEMLDD